MQSRCYRHAAKMLWTGAMIGFALGAAALSEAAPAQGRSFPQTAGRVKTASHPESDRQAVAPLDPGMTLAPAKQFALLAPVPKALIEALQQEGAQENTSTLQIGLHRALDKPLLINRF